MKEQTQLVKRSSEIFEKLLETAPSLATDYNVSAKNSAIDINLRSYWRAVRKRLWLIVGVVMLITTLVAIYMMRKPDIYEARVRLQVELESNKSSLGDSKSNSIVLNNPVNYPAYFNTQLKILSGPGLLRRVAKTLDLEHNQSFMRSPASLTSGWKGFMKTVGLGSKNTPKSQTETVQEVPLVDPATSTTADLVEATKLAPYVEELQDNLSVEPVKEDRLTTKETFLIDIGYQHPDPQLAARIVNTIGETFALSNLERKTQTTAGTGDFLQKRILELQAQIRNGEEQLMNYAKSNQILSLDENQNTVVERLVGLNKQLLEAENERKTAESAYKAALEPGAAEALASDANNKYVADADEKLIELRQRRAQLLVDNTEEWLEVKEVNEQIEAINKQVAETRKRMGAVVLKNLETRFHQAVDKEQKLRAAFDEQRGETLVQNGAAINYRILQQEINTNKSLLDGLLQRAKENDVILHGTPNNVSVIDYAIAPYKPVGPRRMVIVAIAFILSLILSIALALFLDYFDNSIHSIEDVETRLHLPVLGAIPASGGASRRRRRLSATNGLALRNGDKRSELLTHADGRSPIAEAYRQLRTSILLSTAGRAPKSMLITSSLPSEGKTTTAVNVAISLAKTGASVLIIDADMRRPRLHSIFNMDNTQGLSTCLSREMDEAEMSSMVEHHVESGVHMLTSGPVPPTPAELIGSEQMRCLFNTFSNSFQHIIIDSPPITSFTDGVLLSTLVDGVILVVNSGKSSDVIVGRSRQLLLDVGSKIFGVVLNNVDNKAENYYYHSYYAEEASDLAST